MTFIEGSIADRDLLTEIFPGADGIFHRVAIPPVPRAIGRPSPPSRVGAGPGGMDAPTTGPLHGRKVQGIPALFPFPGAHPYEIQVTAAAAPPTRAATSVVAVLLMYAGEPAIQQ
ncbi:hypothetical protein [Methanoculleus bourgensis]|uniref:hypothetical protein n=1 Tax=Methanoculleus bourgensis TaxID=83986 RepID=UPI0022EDAC01|nr:hypothetical protein [Methanoculleus bourgensis]GLI45428.1 hypothetical protein MBOURGENBZM_02200 [Methanoculleus bourgensis]